MTIVERIQKKRDAGNWTAGVFVDLKKTFATVDHNILLENLWDYEILGWFPAESVLPHGEKVPL